MWHLSAVGIFSVALQGSARFAQGSRKVLILQLSSARQVPVTGELILANQGQNRAQANAQARPSRATTCPCASTCPIWLSALLYSELLYSGQLLFFPFFNFFGQFNLMYCTSSWKAHRASDTHCLWHLRWFFFHFTKLRHNRQTWIE